MSKNTHPALWIVLLVLGIVAALGAAAQTKQPTGGQAGVVSGRAVRVPQVSPSAITSALSRGLYCTLMMPNVHNLGWIPADVEVRIEFESVEGSDPIATLTSIRMDGTELGQEWVSSNDSGGTLDPEFQVVKPYDATYVLTVTDARQEASCYSFNVTLR